MTESLQQQVDRLAQFILDEIPGEPSQSQGAIDTAIRLLGQYHTEVTLLRRAVHAEASRRLLPLDGTA